MRVLVLSEGLDLPEFHMLEELRSRGVEITVMLAPGCEYFERLADVDIRAVALTLKSRLDFAGIKQIRAELKRGAYDVFHALRNNRPISNALWASIGIPVKKVAYRGTMGNLSRLDPASWLAYLSPRIDALICVSEAVRQYLLGMGVPGTRAQTVLKGHDVRWYQADGAPTLSEFGIPEDAFVVGCVANMRRLKGVDYVIRSAHHLPEDSKIHYLLVGEVRDEELRGLAEDPAVRGRVHFAGFRSDARVLISGCAVSVMASVRREGLPRAIIESMAQSVVPVVTNVGGMPELVEDGVSGRVVPPRDDQALADAFLALEQDPDLCARYGAAARERIETVFSVQRTAEVTQALYERLVSG